MESKVNERIAEIKERTEKATPEPMTRHRYEHGGGRMYVEALPERHLVADCYDEANREFYFNAREDVPYLLALVQAQEREIAETSAELAKTKKSFEFEFDKRTADKSRLAGLISAAKARQAYEQRTPKYFGHDCHWCSACCDQLINMERAAIAEATK